MRALFLVSTLGTAQSLAVGATSKKPAIQSLMESATTFLKNGATSDVVDFAEETLAEVTSVVIPAIIAESENDQAFIHSLHRRFEVIRQSLNTSNLEVFQLNSEEQRLSGEHKGCRDHEHQKCEGKRNCEMELYRLWTQWVSEEEDLREIHNHIWGHFCPPGTNGTLHSFRVQSVPWMQQYMAQKVVVDTAEVTYDNKVPNCRITHAELDEQSSQCNVLQTNLEETACSLGLKINEVLTTYYNDFAQAESSYHCAVQEIMELERDRKREWITLQVVNCLLVRIREVNGAPCDESTGTVTSQVGICEEQHSRAVCSPADATSTTSGEPRLCLDYPAVPLDPDFCPARDQVVGVCLPVLQAMPCAGEWHNQEYANLPAVPLAPFSHENPGCNAYPECEGCQAITPPTPTIIDACPGYTVDGCDSANAEVGEHPLTHAAGGTADVRCCSIDGDTCQSQDFVGGQPFTTPTGEVHAGCYSQVSYQEAMAVCHAAGQRICQDHEMQTCCSTGCWHDHHAIWVDMDNTLSSSLHSRNEHRDDPDANIDDDRFVNTHQDSDSRASRIAQLPEDNSFAPVAQLD